MVHPARVVWAPAPFSSIWDSDYIVKHLNQQGMAVAFSPAAAPIPSLLWPQLAYQQYSFAGLTPYQHIYVSNVYLASKPLALLVKDITAMTLERSGENGADLQWCPVSSYVVPPCEGFRVNARRYIINSHQQEYITTRHSDCGAIGSNTPHCDVHIRCVRPESLGTGQQGKAQHFTAAALCHLS